MSAYSRMSGQKDKIEQQRQGQIVEIHNRALDLFSTSFLVGIWRGTEEEVKSILNFGELPDNGNAKKTLISVGIGVAVGFGVYYGSSIESSRWLTMTGGIVALGIISAVLRKVRNVRKQDQENLIDFVQGNWSQKKSAEELIRTDARRNKANRGAVRMLVDNAGGLSRLGDQAVKIVQGVVERNDPDELAYYRKHGLFSVWQNGNIKPRQEIEVSMPDAAAKKIIRAERAFKRRSGRGV